MPILVRHRAPPAPLPPPRPVRLLRPTPRIMPRVVLGVLVALALATGFRAERLRDRAQVALPLLGLACAAATGGAPDYALRFAVMWAGIRAGKNGLGRAQVNLRPSGGDGGMPSGHSATASFGASALVHGCLAASPWARGAALVAGGFTGASRIEAGAHTIWQVLAGVLWGIGCDRALRGPGGRRAAIRRRATAMARCYRAGMATAARCRPALRAAMLPGPGRGRTPPPRPLRG